MYEQYLSRRYPGCIIFLVDRSDSMKSPWAGTGLSLAQGAALAINKILLELCIKSTKEAGGAMRNYFYVGVYGYGLCPSTGGEGVESALPGHLAPRGIVPLPELAANPLAIREQPSMDPTAPAGGRVPVWVEPHAGWRTPMCEAFALVGAHVYEWAATFTECFPAIICNMTDGMVSDSPYQGADLVEWASRLTSIRTSDGPAILLNIFLSPSTQRVVSYPSSPGRSARARTGAVLHQQPAAGADGRQRPGGQHPGGRRGSRVRLQRRPVQPGQLPRDRHPRHRPGHVTGMLSAQMVAFHRPKQGSTAAEWEDGAGYDPGDPAAGRSPRGIVVDGATEAYDSIRWVGQLVDSFLGLEAGGRPRLDTTAMAEWFALMQQQWVDRAPATFGTVFEEQKFTRQGSFATLLGCDLDLTGDAPAWRAVALGDAVLFHVRDGRLVGEFPPMARGDFGIDPDGVFTQPAQLDRMRAGVRFGTGPLLAGDVLLLCTDALAAWGVQEGSTRSQPWARLAAVDHPRTFASLVAEQLAGRRLKNDDITMLRVTVSESPANVLVVCSP